METKKINNQWKVFLIGALLAIVSFGFGKVEKAQADLVDSVIEATTSSCTFTAKKDVSDTSANYVKGQFYNIPNVRATTCRLLCKRAGVQENDCKWDGKGILSLTQSVSVGIAEEMKKTSGVCPFEVSMFNPMTLVNCLLLYILAAIGMFLQLAGTIFNLIIKPETANIIINNEVIYKSWAFVRDLLNISFILFLLFSAFCTVFQVDRYSYKKTFRNLILMALLVNFSYPITRFIIDFSNVLMYYLIKSFGLGNTFFAKIADKSFLSNIISPGGNPDTIFLLMSIVFLFIFTVTLFVIAFLLVLRTIALAILIIFSSLAFVGEAIPPLSSYASDWWKKLFNYAFFGPIMVFMLVVSSDMITAIGNAGFGNMKEIASLNSSSPNYLASISFFIIPIIILWFGLGVAQKMGIAGADLAVGRAKKFMNWVPRASWKATGIPGGFKKMTDYHAKKGILGIGGSERREAREAWLGQKFGVKGAKEQDMMKRAKESKDNNETEESQKKGAAAGDAAKAYRLAEDKKMDKDTYDAFMSKNKDAVLSKAVSTKTKQNRADLVALHNARHDTKTQDAAKTRLINKGIATPTSDQIFVEGMSGEISKLNIENFSSQDWSAFETDFNKLPATEQTPISSALIQAWGNYRNEAKIEGRKRLSGASVAALNSMGLTV